MSAVPALHARPRNHEVVLIHHAGPVRVHGSDIGFHDMEPMFGEENIIATVPGDAALLGYGAARIRYSRLRRVRNGRHRLDRAVWDAAVNAVQAGGIVYVQHDLLPYQGEARWTATALRRHIEQPAFRVSFELIGRERNPEDLVTDSLGTDEPDPLWSELGLRIGEYARRFIRSSALEVELDPNLMRGRLLAGPQPAGAFRMTELGAEPVEARRRAAG